MNRIAVIGAGAIAKTHIKAYKYIKDAKICAIVDCNIERAKKVAEICNANYYVSFDEMVLQENVNIIDICLPSYLHKEYILKAFKYEKDVLCEKPLALKLEDAEVILSEKKRCKRKLMIAHCLRFAEEYKYLKHSIDKNRYGKLLHIRLYRNVSIPREQENTWLFDKEKSGGILFDLYIHDLDILYYLLGCPQKSVTYESERFVSGIFAYEGLNCIIESAWRPQKKYDFLAGYDAVFEEVTISNRNGIIEITNDKNREDVHLESDAGQIEEDYLKMYFNEINYFLDCVKNNKEPSQCCIEDNIEVLKMICK